MTYKSILVHVDDAPHALSRYEVAATLALREQAHLVGLASNGVSRFMRDTVAMDFASHALAPYMETLKKRAGHAIQQYEMVAARVGVDGFESRMVEEDPSETLGILARYCDLCVVSQYDPAAPASPVRPGMAADVAAGSGCPVLVVPNTGLMSGPMRRIMLGWNGSREASRAMHYAMPLLCRADHVEVAIIGDTATEAAGGMRVDSAIGQALARHGIHAEIVHRPAGEDAGTLLLALAAERGAELLVMGCYGHSRIRERLLGGATRSVLQTMEIPVLMAA